MESHRKQQDVEDKTMLATALREDGSRSVTINLRASEHVRAIIDRAAALLGKSRTEFMLDSARRHAEDVLLDQQLFLLDEERFKSFVKLLDEAPKPSEELKKLMRSKAPWTR